MEKNKKHLWQLAAAFVSGAVITALVFVAASGSLFQGALFKKAGIDTKAVTATDVSKAKTASTAFNVEIKPIQPVTHKATYSITYYQGTDGIVNGVKVGDTIDFKKIVTNPSNYPNSGFWQLDFNPFYEYTGGVVKCDLINNDVLRCNALKTGQAYLFYQASWDVNSGIYAGTTGGMSSNGMTIKVQ